MLKRVSIQNFKSLKDVTLDLQKVNLLIGPNNSGKTNFLKALEFMALVSFKREEPIFDIPLDNHFNKGSGGMSGSIFVDLIFDAIGGKLFDHFLLLDADGNYFISHYNSDESTKFILPKEFEVSTTESADQYWLSMHLSGLKIYKPDPNQLIKPGPVGLGDELVNADVSNLVGFLDLMLSKYRRPVFNRVETDLSTCIPEFGEVILDDAPATDELKRQYGDKSFKRIGLANSQQDIIYWADELSEGTLYFLALLCIINQPNPPKLLLLEEPEKGIHPRRIREVMDFIFRLAEEKDIQIILTTHNEHVLDDFATRPEAVFVFDKDEEGATYVRNLQTDIIEPTNQRNAEMGLDPIDLTTNLSENWLFGLLGGVPPIV